MSCGALVFCQQVDCDVTLNVYMYMYILACASLIDVYAFDLSVFSHHRDTGSYDKLQLARQSSVCASKLRCMLEHHKKDPTIDMQGCESLQLFMLDTAHQCSRMHCIENL